MAFRFVFIGKENSAKEREVTGEVGGLPGASHARVKPQGPGAAQPRMPALRGPLRGAPGRHSLQERGLQERGEPTPPPCSVLGLSPYPCPLLPCGQWAVGGEALSQWLRPWDSPPHRTPTPNPLRKWSHTATASSLWAHTSARPFPQVREVAKLDLLNPATIYTAALLVHGSWEGEASKPVA